MDKISKQAFMDGYLSKMASIGVPIDPVNTHVEPTTMENIWEMGKGLLEPKHLAIGAIGGLVPLIAYSLWKNNKDKKQPSHQSPADARMESFDNYLQNQGSIKSMTPEEHEQAMQRESDQRLQKPYYNPNPSPEAMREFHDLVAKGYRGGGACDPHYAQPGYLR